MLILLRILQISNIDPFPGYQFTRKLAEIKIQKLVLQEGIDWYTLPIT